MNELRSLADQLRSEISAPDTPQTSGKGKQKQKTSQEKHPDIDARAEVHSQILDEIKAYDNTNHKNMVHVRFDASTVQLLNHFKMATNVDVTKLVAFSVHSLFKTYPELKSIIRQFIQKLEL